MEKNSFNSDSMKKNYIESLQRQYENSNSLMSKKLKIVDSYLDTGESLLDIGVGTGEFIFRQKNKFDKIYGVDKNQKSVEFCHNRFEEDKIQIRRGGIKDLSELFENKEFNYITALDVLEHLNLEDTKESLKIIHSKLKEDGKFIFTGPGFFEKIRILLNLSNDHKHSHSPQGWKKLIEEAGLSVTTMETVEFPILNKNYLRKRFLILGKCLVIVSEK